MKTILLQVGKTTDRHVQALADDYVDRLSHYVPFSVVTIPELRNTRNLTPQQQCKAEGDLILRQLQPTDVVVLLDEHGRQYSSVAFARRFESWAHAARRLVFVIGGPYGFDPAVYARADDQLSLSPMTFSHQMVRVIFIEQLYRCCTILRGEPYHHE